MSTLTQDRVLAEAILPQMGTRKLLKQVALIVAGVLALWISARTQIGTVPVPITLQMLVVMVIGAAYGPKLGGLTLLAYLGAGAAGYPVFAGTPEKGIGLLYMFGPTGGYLLGFFAAAVVVGALAERGWDRSFGKMLAAMAIGLVCVYLPGVVWLSSGFNLLFGNSFLAEPFMGYGWANWYANGVKDFIWVDAIKLVVAVLAFPTVWKLVGNART